MDSTFYVTPTFESDNAMIAEALAASYMAANPLLSKHNNISLMLAEAGDSVFLIRNDTRRHASILTINGARLTPVSHTYDNYSRAWNFTATAPLADGEGHLSIHRHIIPHRNRFLSMLTVTNPTEISQPVRVDLDYSARQFLGMFEMRGLHTQTHFGRVPPPRVADNVVIFDNYGARQAPPADRLRQTTHLVFAPQPHKLRGGFAGYETVIPPGEAQNFYMAIATHEITPGKRAPKPTRVCPAEKFRAVQRRLPEIARPMRRLASSIVTNNPEYNQTVATALTDQEALCETTAAGKVPVAGLPWFDHLFGRDPMIAAILNMWRDPNMAKGVIAAHAAHQAMADSADGFVKRGQTIHEICNDECVRAHQLTARRNYNEIDGPGLFVTMGGMHYDRTGDVETARRYMPHYRAALEYYLGSADLAGDGLIRYQRRREIDPANTGWKDSSDPNFHADGSLTQGRVALVGVQAIGVEAFQHGEKLARVVAGAERRDGNEAGWRDNLAFAETCRAKAVDLRRQIEERFWVDELKTYGTAIDERGLTRVRVSDAGWVLGAGVGTPDRARHVVSMLTGPDMFSGWGIRTVHAAEKMYDPEIYQRGPVWNVDNAFILRGFRNYGYLTEIARVHTSLAEAAPHFGHHAPELFSGKPRREGEGPGAYENACRIHLFGAASVPGMLPPQLGIRFAPAAREIVFERPYMPEFFQGAITMRGIGFGKHTADLRLEGEGTDVRFTMLRSNGVTARIASGPG